MSRERSLADNGWEGRILSLTWENDATFGTDRHYTEGALISYLSRDEALPKWLSNFSDQIPVLGLDVQARKFGLGVGQDIYTPEQLDDTNFIPDDRPFAGWLYGSFVLQRRGETSPMWVMENFRLDLGVVGPDAMGEITQDITHHRKPRGWSNQLHTEPAFALRYDRRYLWRLTHEQQRWGADLLPSFTGSGGTVATFAGLGATARFGYRIPNEFEAPKQSTSRHYGAYLFTSAEGRYVVRNIFLDGNTFGSSAHIEKQPFVAELRVGITLVLKSVELTAAQTLRTREFKGQNGNDSYGTVVMTIKF